VGQPGRGADCSWCRARHPLASALALLPKTQTVVDDFQLIGDADRLMLLLEYSERLPEPPEEYRDNPELLERVDECQSPVFIAVAGSSKRVELIFSAPREAPTTRGFAALLYEALNELPASEILSLHEDFPNELKLEKLISPLRMRGIRGMLARIKRQTRELFQAVD
jgi:cysteine desulfuration protein SufE